MKNDSFFTLPTVSHSPLSPHCPHSPHCLPLPSVSLHSPLPSVSSPHALLPALLHRGPPDVPDPGRHMIHLLTLPTAHSCVLHLLMCCSSQLCFTEFLQMFRTQADSVLRLDLRVSPYLPICLGLNVLALVPCFGFVAALVQHCLFVCVHRGAVHSPRRSLNDC
jgi:hypothetical protein